MNAGFAEIKHDKSYVAMTEHNQNGMIVNKWMVGNGGAG